MIKNVLTVDVEDMSHSRYGNPAAGGAQIDEKLISSSIDLLLEMLDRRGAKATFFILGVIARKLPALVRRIHENGHETASHGFLHRPVYYMTPDEFRRDLESSIRAVEDASGSRVIGYRAPYWSVTQRSMWALDIIRDHGIMYDSSISPVVNFLYGVKGAPRTAYRNSRGLWEVPPTTCSLFGRLIIIGGGFYLRALPLWFTKRCMRTMNEQGSSALMYLHPHELVNHAGSERLSFTEDFILNFNKGSFNPKFSSLLEEFVFCPVKEALGLHD